MGLYCAAKMREMDRYAIDVLKIPSLRLMEMAAGFVADEAERLLKKGGHAVVFCGSGNNGGDGVAAAVKLIADGIPVRVFLTGSREKMTADTAEMEKRLIAAGGALEDYSEAEGVREYTLSGGVIIDAIFGVGLNSQVRGAAASAVELINSAEVPVVSADVPSGISADTGMVQGCAVRADVTVTFTAGKPGIYVTPGCIYAGQVRVCDIGIPKSAAAACADAHTVCSEDIRLPRRSCCTHKGDYGRDLIIAGSVGYTGAPVLAADAASRSGAGLVSLCVPKSIYEITAVRCREVMPTPLPCTEQGRLSAGAADEILERLNKCDVCLAGPGLGVCEDTKKLVALIVENSKAPLVLDADGINALEGNINILKKAACPIVLTPHEGEFARMGGDLSGGRIAGAREAAARLGAVIVLKGYRTVTALPDGQVFINMTGGPALAKGGSGDVLAGVTASLLGQKFPVKDAVLAAVCLHGRAGDICAERLGDYSVGAGDLIGALPQAITER